MSISGFIRKRRLGTGRDRRARRIRCAAPESGIAKPLLSLLAAVLLVLAAGACGGAGQIGSRMQTGSSRMRTSGTRAQAGSTPRRASTAASTGSKAVRPPWQSPVVHEPAYLNDGDRESPGDPDKDYVEDEDADSRFHENSRYHDADDSGVVTFGQPAPAAAVQQVRTLVERYYAMAAARDGAGACAELVPHIARSAAADYGQFGPSYLRGSKTCGTVTARVFEHSHIDFSIPFAVTEVRVRGDEGMALLGFKTAPAGYIAVEREAGSWWVAEMLPHRLS